MIVLLLSGPNLKLLGEREPAIYGSETLDDHVRTATDAAAAHGLELEHLQSNGEAELVAAVHAARGRCAAIVVNAGALTHYGWSLHDALAAFDTLARMEGILPALESAHAIAHAIKVAKAMSQDQQLVVCLSGRGDKDAAEIARLKSATGA